jgi:hypothetical protein
MRKSLIYRLKLFKIRAYRGLFILFNHFLCNKVFANKNKRGNFATYLNLIKDQIHTPINTLLTV